MKISRLDWHKTSLDFDAVYHIGAVYERQNPNRVAQVIKIALLL